MGDKPTRKELEATVEELDGKLGEAETEIASLTDRLARARADYKNLESRQAREAELERERVKARVLDRFLQVFEYGQMAAMEAEKNPGPLAEGVKMVVREFERMLTDEGLTMISDEVVGAPFDARTQEALAEEEGEPGTVVRVIRPGYLLGDRVLRHAKVAVAPYANEEE